MKKSHIAAALMVTLLAASRVPAEPEPVPPISGEQLEQWISSQDMQLQDLLAGILPESAGYFITGPLDPAYDGDLDGMSFYRTVRVVCPDLPMRDSALFRLQIQSSVQVLEVAVDSVASVTREDSTGYRGAFAVMRHGANIDTVQVITYQQLRWLIWARRTLFGDTSGVDMDRLREYARAVSRYLQAMDRCKPNTDGRVGCWDPQSGLPPETEVTILESGVLPQSLALYAPDPDYVIEGYDNYKSFLRSYRPIYTDFARGVVSFVPSDSLRNALIRRSPREAYRNKEAAKLQEEFDEFLQQRGGNWTIIATLTAEAFDTLVPGEYFFAVGLDGSVRFGRELPREEVKRIEETTGRKPARANHAFLFPGEPVLTAGAFFVEVGDDHRIAAINAQSGHYFYSNIQPSIREDIAERSDHYLLTLGHFLQALESLGIPYENAAISKM